ncbi:hypothetical protein [Photobacterium marinum]|nr:hypothetical protein [Photobacterium marinum]
MNRPTSPISFWVPNIIFGALLVAWFPVAIVMLLRLDEPEVTASIIQNIVTQYIDTSIVAYPIYYLLGLILSWRSYRKGESLRKVLVFAFIPLLSGFIWSPVLVGNIFAIVFLGL